MASPRAAAAACVLLAAALAPARAWADDDVVLRTTHHTVKKQGYMDSQEILDLKLDRLTKIEVKGGFHPTVTARFRIDDGGEERTWAAADRWTLRRGSRSVDLIDILVESAPDDQDLFLVDWEHEGIERLRRAMRWYGDPAWAEKQTAGKPVWRSGQVKYGSDWNSRLDLERIVSMRVDGDKVHMKVMGTNPELPPHDRTIPLEESEIIIGLRKQPLRHHLQGLLPKGARLQGAELSLEQIIGGPMPEPGAAPRRAGGRVARRTTAAKPARTPPVKASFPEWKDTPLIYDLGRDVTREAAAGKLDPFVGRQEDLRKLMRSLLRPNKGALLVGEPGTGKTALVEGLAQMIADGTVPEALRGKRIIEIPFTNLNTNTRYTGMLEDKIAQVLKELGLHKDEVIVFIDEAHNLIGLGTYEGSDRDVAEMIKGPLARGEMGRAIFATTPDEAEAFDRDKAFRRRLIAQKVKPSSIADTETILRGRRARIQERSGVRIADDALRAAAELGARVPERFLPDSALDLVDDAVADAQLDGKKRVTRELVESRFRELTGIEPSVAGGSQRAAHVKTLGPRLKKHVVGQDHAADTLAEAARRSGAGVEDEDRPQGAFLFAGPTGVGKTEMARALAIEHYGSKDALLRLDMSEYQSPLSVDTFIANLARLVRRRPHAVVLFDEGEKASDAIHNVMLQILEDGRLTWKGQTISFRETILVMTSNVGAAERSQGAVGFGNNGRPDPSRDRAITRKALAQTFRAEFVNRWDEIIDFNALTRKDIEKIVDLQIDRINKRMASRTITVSLSPAARARLAAEGYDPKSGARELRRAANRRVRTSVADALLDGRVTDGDAVTVGVRHGRIDTRKKRVRARTAPARSR